MKNCKHTVSLALDLLEDRQLPGNMLSVLLAMDFKVPIPSELRPVQPSHPLASLRSQALPRLAEYDWIPLVSSWLQDYRPTFNSILAHSAVVKSEQIDDPNSIATVDYRWCRNLDVYDDLVLNTTAIPPVSPTEQFAVNDMSSASGLNNQASIAQNSSIMNSNDDPMIVSGSESDSSLEVGLQPMFSMSPPIGDPPPGGSFLEQDVIINANNDNGSQVADYIPAKRDFDATHADYPDGKLDSELVALQLIDDTPPPWNPLIIVPGIDRYRIEITQPGAGRVRLWDSYDKENEFTVFGQHTTQNLVPHPFQPGKFIFPEILVEGVKNSLIRNDITISLTVDYEIVDPNLQTVPWTAHFRPVKFSVTPVVLSFSVDRLEKPYFVNGSDAGGGFRGDAIIKATHYQPNSAYYVSFVQFNNEDGNNLPGGFGVTYQLNIQNPKKLTKKPDNQQAGPNKDYAFLDSDEASIPFYSTNNYETSNVDGTSTISLFDSPEIALSPLVNEVDITMNLQTYLTVGYSQPCYAVDVVFPLGYVTWSLRYKADTYENGKGVTNNLSSAAPASPYPAYTPTNSFNAAPNQRVRPSFANNGIGWQ